MNAATARTRLLRELDEEYGPQQQLAGERPRRGDTRIKGVAPPLHAETNARRIVIIGTGRIAQRLGRLLDSAAPTPMQFEGFLDDNPCPGVKTLGRIHDLERIARTRFLDEVIVCLPDDIAKARRAVFLSRQLNLNLKVVPETYGCDLQLASAGMLDTIPLLTLREKPVPASRLFGKRCFDVIASGGLFVLLLPVLALISILIRLNSPGPVLYSALRMGRRGHAFRCCKFRTMRTEADQEKPKLRKQNERSGPFFKMKDDPRVTSLGRILRRYSLDELPQLWNVLLGDMSLVGPRPHPLDDHALYTPEHMQRLTVTPGLTGLWQVTARSDPSFERNMALDREYIEKQSMSMDLWILFRTVREVAMGSGV